MSGRLSQHPDFESKTISTPLEKALMLLGRYTPDYHEEMKAVEEAIDQGQKVQTLLAVLDDYLHNTDNKHTYDKYVELNKARNALFPTDEPPIDTDLEKALKSLLVIIGKILGPDHAGQALLQGH